MSAEPKVYCATVGCRKRRAKARSTGLCEDHHQELVHDHESPLDITGTGRWVVRRGIRVWQPTPPGVHAQQRADAIFAALEAHQTKTTHRGTNAA